MKEKLTNILLGIITFLSSVIMILNFSSGIVGGIWLAFLGEWGLLIYGFLLGILMPFAYTITLLPSMLFMFLIGFAQKHRNYFLISVFGFLGSLVSNLIIAYWTYFVFVTFLNRAEPVSVIPILLWGYSTVLGPLSYMAQKEGPDSTGSYMGVLLAIICYLVLTIIAFIGYPSFNHLIIVSAIFSFITMTLISPALVDETESRYTNK